jgi:hypothetical protein
MPNPTLGIVKKMMENARYAFPTRTSDLTRFAVLSP